MKRIPANYLKITNKQELHCGATGLVVAREHWDVGSIPSLTQRVKDAVWPQLQLGRN